MATVLATLLGGVFEGRRGVVSQQMKFAPYMTRSNDKMQCSVKVLKMASSDQVSSLSFHVREHIRRLKTVGWRRGGGKV